MPTPIRRWKLPKGDAGTRATAQAMRAVVRNAIETSARVHHAAQRIAARHPRDQQAQLAAVYRFVRRRVAFKADLAGAEHLRTPDNMLADIARYGATAADCDDSAMLTASLVGALGISPGFALMGSRAGGPFHHVCAVAKLGGRIVPMDPQERAPIGSLVPQIARLAMLWV